MCDENEGRFEGPCLEVSWVRFCAEDRLCWQNWEGRYMGLCRAEPSTMRVPLTSWLLLVFPFLDTRAL